MRIDVEGLRKAREALADAKPEPGLPFRITKLGHVVLAVQDLERSAAFYTGILGFRISDVYPDSMIPGGMVFMRCNADHHGVALVGGSKQAAQNAELHHLAFEVATLDEVLRASAHLKANGVKVDFEGRRRAGCQVAVEFRDPDNHRLEIYWGLDQIGTDGHVRPPEEWREALSIGDAIDNPPKGQDTSLQDPTLRKR